MTIYRQGKPIKQPKLVCISPDWRRKLMVQVLVEEKQYQRRQSGVGAARVLPGKLMGWAEPILQWICYISATRHWTIRCESHFKYGKEQKQVKWVTGQGAESKVSLGRGWFGCCQTSVQPYPSTVKQSQTHWPRELSLPNPDQLTCLYCMPKGVSVFQGQRHVFKTIHRLPSWYCLVQVTHEADLALHNEMDENFTRRHRNDKKIMTGRNIRYIRST